jgi:hypothetical protein
MADAIGSINFLKLWTQSDYDYKLKKYVEMGLDRRIIESSGVLKKLEIGRPTSHPEVQWYEQESYAHAVTATLASTTMTFSGTLMGTSLASVTTAGTQQLKNIIRVGTILERPSDGVQAKVTDITNLSGAGTYNVTVVAYGNTSLSNDTSAVSWEILTEPWKDATDMNQPRALDRERRKVGTEIFAEGFEIEKTRENTSMEVVGDEIKHQTMELIDKLNIQLSRAVIRQRPYYSSGFKYGLSTQDPTLCGLSIWPEIVQAEASNPAVYVNLSSANLTKNNLDTLVKNMWLTENADFDTGNWSIVCHPNTYQYMQNFDIAYMRETQDSKKIGISKTIFHSKIGKDFPIISDRHMRESELLVVNFTKCKYGYYKNDRLDIKELPTKGRYRQWLISFQAYGVVARNPRANIGKIYGISNT